MTPAIERDLGRHEALIGTHAERLENIEGKLDQVLSTLQQAKGGMRTLVAVGGVAGAVGAFIAELIPHIPFK